MKQVDLYEERGGVMIRVFAFVFVCAALLPLSVSATKAESLSFDPETGRGFVPKSMIQSSFELSNGQVKKLSGNVSFDVTYTFTVQISCANGTEAEQASQAFFAVTAAPDGPPGQFTGWKTTGLVLIGHSDPLPISELCNGDGTPSSDTETSHILVGRFLGKSVVLDN